MMKQKKWIIIISILIIVLICSFIIIKLSTPEKKEYQTYKVNSKALVNTINTNGNLSRVSTTKISVVGGIIIGQVFVEEGDLVKEGDKLLEIDLNSLEQLEMNYEDLVYNYKEQLKQETDTKWETSVKATTSGRVKFIAGESKDEDLLVLSLNGMMSVEFNSTSEFAIGSKVVIKTSTNKEYKGTITKKNKGSYIAEITDNGPDYKDKVTVWSENSKIGEGELSIEMPFIISGDYSNVESFAVTNNENVTMGAELLKWKKNIISDSYSIIYNKLNEAEKKLEKIKKLKVSPYILAETTGIVSDLQVKEGDRISEENDVIIGEILGDELEFVALVNEKYIMSLKENMKATLYLTALNGEKIETSIAEIGKKAKEVGEAAYFEVKFNITNYNGLYEGMSGKVVINLEEADTGVVIPLSLVNQDSEGNEYVYISDDASNGLRKKVIIKTGISNEDYVQILSGLSEGDLISYEGNLLTGIAE